MANLLQRIAAAFRDSSADLPVAIEHRSEPVMSIEVKASAAATAIVATGVGQPVWTPRDYKKFALEGYQRNTIAFHCIAMIAQSAAFVPLILRVKSTKKEIDDHPLLDLLNKPAPNMTGTELIERTITYLKIHGNAYLEKVGPDRKGSKPIELYSHRPDRMKVIAGKNAVPMAFEYEANGQKVRWNVDAISGLSDIMQLKLMNPLDDWYGMSAMEPSAYAIDRHNEAGAHNMALLQNGAVPSGALAFKPVVIDGQSINAPSAVIDAAEKKLNERHAGSANAGKPMTLGGNVEWLSFGMSMEQLQLNESKLDAARDICTAFGVPFILVVPGQSTYNNNREAKLALYEETVLPTLQWVLDHMNVWLTPSFGDDLELIMDLDSVDALSPRRDEKRLSTIALFDDHLITRSEAREFLKFSPIAGLADFEPQSHEVSALVQLILGGKLSMSTGLKQMQLWNLLPVDIDVDDEVEKVDQEGGDVNGMTGIDPATGLPLNAPIDPLKPQNQLNPPAPPIKPKKPVAANAP